MLALNKNAFSAQRMRSLQLGHYHVVDALPQLIIFSLQSIRLDLLILAFSRMLIPLLLELANLVAYARDRFLFFVANLCIVLLHLLDGQCLLELVYAQRTVRVRLGRHGSL